MPAAGVSGLSYVDGVEIHGPTDPSLLAPSSPSEAVPTDNGGTWQAAKGALVAQVPRGHQVRRITTNCVRLAVVAPTVAS